MFTFMAEPDGGEAYEIKTSVRDIRKWEKESGKSFQKISEDFDLSDAYLLAYYGSVRMGKFKGTLEEFEDIVDFELPQMEEAPLATSKEA